MEVPFVQEMQCDEQFGWLYVWQSKNVENRRRFFGGYVEGSHRGMLSQRFAIPAEYQGGILKIIHNEDDSYIQIYEVTGPIISKLPRLLQIYESTFGAI